MSTAGDAEPAGDAGARSARGGAPATIDSVSLTN
jgi:hypothetical protein